MIFDRRCFHIAFTVSLLFEEVNAVKVRMILKGATGIYLSTEFISID
jgi:hypothetical protein